MLAMQLRCTDTGEISGRVVWELSTVEGPRGALYWTNSAGDANGHNNTRHLPALEGVTDAAEAWQIIQAAGFDT